MYLLADERKATHNSTLAIGGVSCSADSFVVAKVQFSELTFVLKSPPIANLQNVMCNPVRRPNKPLTILTVLH
jgi:hypothetical protein